MPHFSVAAMDFFGKKDYNKPIFPSNRGFANGKQKAICPVGLPGDRCDRHALCRSSVCLVYFESAPC
jgi:hypothetical protein